MANCHSVFMANCHSVFMAKRHTALDYEHKNRVVIP